MSPISASIVNHHQLPTIFYFLGVVSNMVQSSSRDHRNKYYWCRVKASEMKKQEAARLGIKHIYNSRLNKPKQAITRMDSISAELLIRPDYVCSPFALNPSKGEWASTSSVRTELILHRAELIMEEAVERMQ